MQRQNSVISASKMEHGNLQRKSKMILFSSSHFFSSSLIEIFAYGMEFLGLFYFLIISCIINVDLYIYISMYI